MWKNFAVIFGIFLFYKFLSLKYSLLQKIGATAVFENKPVVERSEVVIVSLKPDVVAPVLKEVKDLPASKNKLFISIAMGVNTTSIEKVISHSLSSFFCQ